MIETKQRVDIPHRFGSLPVSAAIARSLDAMRYATPTPVQEQSIPHLREGRDLMAQAQTGTGKTAAFGIPLIEAMDPEDRGVQAIVLVPTRELCIQVADELQRLGANAGVSVLAVYGGVGLSRQIDALRRGTRIVIGTPGRVEDLMQRRDLKLGAVRFAILDEADRMLDVGFAPAIERILRATPSGRQTALYSATIPDDVRALAARHTRNPVTVLIDPERATVEEIDQHFERIEDGDKLSALQAHLDDPACYLALIFRRTTFKADRLTKDLTKRGYKAAVLHGRRSQSQRERVLADLKSGKLQALVATDIAARGLDIGGLTHVFNFDLPDTPETYVHRIGRTGRAGETGTAITFVSPEDELALKGLERYLAGHRTGTRMGAGQQKPSQNGGRRGDGGRGGESGRSAGNRHSSSNGSTGGTARRRPETGERPRRSPSRGTWGRPVSRER
ncbi:MAG: DEAD/DEAH box helicase [Chloroflexota bacterium]